MEELKDLSYLIGLFVIMLAELMWLTPQLLEHVKNRTDSARKYLDELKKLQNNINKTLPSTSCKEIDIHCIKISIKDGIEHQKKMFSQYGTLINWILGSSIFLLFAIILIGIELGLRIHIPSRFSIYAFYIGLAISVLVPTVLFTVLGVYFLKSRPVKTYFKACNQYYAKRDNN